MLKFLRWPVQASVLAVAAIQLAGFGQRLHPLLDSIGHFRLHLAALLVVGFLLLLVLRLWRLAAISAAVVIASVAMMSPAISLGSLSTATAASAPDFTLLQFNTLFGNRQPQTIVPQVEAAKPDVITLEEVSPAHTAKIMDLLRSDYPYQRFCQFKTDYGVAVLSRWPPVTEGCAEGQGLVWMRINRDGREVTVATVHLYWPYPFEQPQQVGGLEPLLAALPQPVVIGGDFNAAPWSTTVQRIAEASQTHVSQGLRLSYMRWVMRRWRVPILPIDHVLIPRGATADVRIGEYAHSDHLPVVARITLPAS
jgi:endonuclease/exonuclease/phosphatase (EEP) superfamily protein YafD